MSSNCTKETNENEDEEEKTDAELWQNMMTSMLNFAMASTELMKIIRTQMGCCSFNKGNARDLDKVFEKMKMEINGECAGYCQDKEGKSNEIEDTNEDSEEEEGDTDDDGLCCEVCEKSSDDSGKIPINSKTPQPIQKKKHKYSEETMNKIKNIKNVEGSQGCKCTEDNLCYNDPPCTCENHICLDEIASCVCPLPSSPITETTKPKRTSKEIPKPNIEYETCSCSSLEDGPKQKKNSFGNNKPPPPSKPVVEYDTCSCSSSVHEDKVEKKFAYQTTKPPPPPIPEYDSCSCNSLEEPEKNEKRISFQETTKPPSKPEIEEDTCSCPSLQEHEKYKEKDTSQKPTKPPAVIPEDEYDTCSCSSSEDKEKNEKKTSYQMVIKTVAAPKPQVQYDSCSCSSLEDDQTKTTEEVQTDIQKTLKMIQFEKKLKETNENLKDLKKEVERITNLVTGKKKTSDDIAVALYQEIMKPRMSIEEVTSPNMCTRKL